MESNVNPVYSGKLHIAVTMLDSRYALRISNSDEGLNKIVGQDSVLFGERFKEIARFPDVGAKAYYLLIEAAKSSELGGQVDFEKLLK
ncbi:MAG TPA: hypothetical protein VJI46_03300 [Candidatus Nanoarchaeia archaeon]|nr:hypothetical protein [Candidatus Nanoarchaeia archaeon]